MQRVFVRESVCERVCTKESVRESVCERVYWRSGALVLAGRLSRIKVVCRDMKQIRHLKSNLHNKHPLHILNSTSTAQMSRTKLPTRHLLGLDTARACKVLHCGLQCKVVLCRLLLCRLQPPGMCQIGSRRMVR